MGHSATGHFAPGHFDFDFWRDLAEADPEGYFRARQKAIDEMIDACAPERRERLRQMQCSIDCIRAGAGCPMRAVGGLCLLMRERLVALAREQDALRSVAAALRDAVAPASGCD